MLHKLLVDHDKGDGQWLCHCPAHLDKHPSLILTWSGKKWLMHCRAGCPTDVILDKLGCSFSDLWENPLDIADGVRPHKVSDAAVYAALLDDSPIHATDVKQLQDRGIIEVSKYGTLTPNKLKHYLAEYPSCFYELKMGGLLIPIRDREGSLVSLIVRSGGKCKYAFLGKAVPSHWSKYSSSESLLIVEGMLKADAVASLLHQEQYAGLSMCDVVGVNGTGTTPEKAKIPPAAHVYLAWDMDGKDSTEESRNRWSLYYRQLGCKVTLLEWDKHKGIDDAMKNKTEIRQVIEDLNCLVKHNELVCFADMEPQPLEWLWDNWIPRGSLILLEGDPEVGKSTLSIDFVREVTNPQKNSGWNVTDAEHCLLLFAEDDTTRVVLPRLKAAEVDTKYCWTLRNPTLLLPEGIKDLETLIVERDIRLVVIDPISAFLSPDCDTNREADVRKALQPLANMAGRTGCSVVLVRHLNKATGLPTLYRGLGSIAFIALCRVCLSASASPEPGMAMLSVTKNNLSPKQKPRGYRVVSSDTGVGKISWTDSVPPASMEERLLRWLKRELKDGPQYVSDVLAAAEKEGLNRKTLEKVRNRIADSSRDECNRWIWELKEANIEE